MIIQPNVGGIQLPDNVGCVDLGDLAWEIPNGYTNLFFAFGFAFPFVQKSVICGRYSTNPNYGGWSVADQSDKTLTVNANTMAMNIKDSDYTSAEEFKAAVKGVLLFYRLVDYPDE